MKTQQSNATGAAVFILIGLMVLSWLFGKMPEQSWWYDQTPPCPAGQELYLDGSALKC